MNSKLGEILSKIIDKYSEDNKTSEYDLNKDSHISDYLYKNEIFNGGKGFSCNCGAGHLDNGETDPIPNSFYNKEEYRKLYGPKYFLCNYGKCPNCFLCNCRCNPNNNNNKCYKDLIINDE